MIKILAADDEPFALSRLERCIKNSVKEAEVFSFEDPLELLEFAKTTSCDIAFLDVRMYGMTGVEVAKKLKEFNPNINVIFVTGYDEYVGEAMAMHASGYVTKPVTEEKILQEVADLRYPISQTSNKKLIVKCFGNFEVLDKNQSILHFDRKKAKELLAYLIYKQGASCTVKEVSSVIFEDNRYDSNQQRYFQTIISSLVSSLRAVGAESIVQRSYGNVSVDIKQIDCDWLNFLSGDESQEKFYHGDFMAQYSWAEMENGYLTRIILHKRG
ncbi:MAG: response regulator [Clostridiales bacterium]|nr:response regulator [Clostridiales bacterium]